MGHLVELHQVSKRFAMGEQHVAALRNVDLIINEGEFVAIMGPSGSGKTTCLEIMGAMSRPDVGSYRFDGLAVEALDDDELAELRARCMGFVFQSFHLMPRMSALRNVALPLLYSGVPRRRREEQAADLLDQFGLGRRLDHRPAQLSGGERQRVAIARALANDPRVILADEPTGNLDQETGREILRIFRELHQRGRTLAVVTHSEAVAANAQRIVHLRDGRIDEHARA